MMDIILNGETKKIESGLSLDLLLDEEGIDPDDARGVAVARNDEIVRRESWSNTTLEGGDRVEIVAARQGG